MISACDRALSIQPENIDILLIKGKAFVKLNKFEDAVITFDQALEYNNAFGSL